MFISKTPLRISLFSGGDMKSYYSKSPGACLSCTIDKYVYVSLLIHHETDYSVRTMYEQTETVKDLNEIRHDIVREALKSFNVANGVTIASMTDIPASGTGLGSSSAFTVGLLNALAHVDNDRYGMADECNHRYWLAEEACELEIETCGHPIGKQDQYAAALGGLNFMKFWDDERVDVQTSSLVQRNSYKLQEKLLLVYTGISRKADDILTEQNANLTNDPKAFDALRRNAIRAHQGYQALQANCLDEIGELLHDAWLDKKSIASGITNQKIDDMYSIAQAAGATGGKVIGAGGGGFMVFFCPNHHIFSKVRNKLANYGVKDYPFKFVDHGSRVTEV